MIIHKLHEKGLIHPPKWLPDNCHYLTIMGSDAYGVSSGSSDLDIYGWCIPHKRIVFPHLSGHIPGFGQQPEKFEQWSEHHIKDTSSDKEYDFAVYSIVKYFQLIMENNPNMIDSLFTPRRCIIHSTKISEFVRSKRKDFLHKGAWHKFKGYSYSQMHKMDIKSNASNPKRDADIQKYGMDTKFAYHVVRLLCEVEQILVEGDLDLERNSEQLKSIRRGELTLDQIKGWFTDKEKSLEEVYNKSELPYKADEDKIKGYLLEALEMHYGSLGADVYVDPSKGGLINNIERDIKEVLEKYK